MRSFADLLFRYLERGECPHPSRQKGADHWASELRKSGKVDESTMNHLEKLRQDVKAKKGRKPFIDAVLDLIEKEKCLCAKTKDGEAE